MHAGQIPDHTVYALLILLRKQSKCINQLDLGLRGHEDQRLSEGVG